VSYWLAVLLRQEEAHWSAALKVLLLFCSVTAAVLPQSYAISKHGLALQACAVFLDALWQRLHLRSVRDNPSTESCRTSTPLVLLADSAPAAVLILLVPLRLYDIPKWGQQQFRMRPELPLAAVACMLLCVLMLLKLQSPVMLGRVGLPTGPLVQSARDIGLAVVAAKLLNEHLASWQWLAYAVAQLAATSLWMGSSGLSSGTGGAFTKLLPITN